MKPELKQKWVEALRSGEYRQGREALRNGDLFCCLGVLCDVAMPGEWDADEDHAWGSVEGGFLSEDALLIVGLTDDDQQTLYKMNDGDILENMPPHDFTEIADYIETNL